MKRNSISKVAAFLLVGAMMVGVTACSGDAEESTTTEDTTAEAGTDSDSEEVADGEVAKPDSIVYMGTTMNFTSGNGLEEWVAEFENETDIDLDFVKPDHNSYFENLSLSFTAGDAPDIFETGSTYYPSYAINGALWDMTDAWENSDLNASDSLDESYVDNLYIDGSLYGFPMTAGNGTITYVRGDWMDKLGLEAPTNYDEYYDMLYAFTYDDPDGNGEDDTYGMTAPGLVSSETPYAIYLREFYQDAEPGLTMVDGQYVDGMLEDNMVDALTRMQDAYSEGLIDREVVTNKTSTCRDKFYSGQTGVFNYWAGIWNENLQNNLNAQNPEGTVVPIPAIEETQYIERPATPMAIYSGAENPEGIFKYFIEFAHDGAEGEMLFTYGMEGYSYEWDDDSHTTATMLINPESGTPFTKSYFSPELTINTAWTPPVEVPEIQQTSLDMFRADSVFADVPVTNETINTNLPEVNTIRNQTIAEVVTGAKTVEEGLAEYAESSAAYMDPILESLNQ